MASPKLKNQSRGSNRIWARCHFRVALQGLRWCNTSSLGAEVDSLEHLDFSDDVDEELDAQKATKVVLRVDASSVGSKHIQLMCVQPDHPPVATAKCLGIGW